MARFQVKKAKREEIWCKVALMGASGSGKSYSALRLATGMADEIEKNTGERPKILFANTEGKRGYYYANEFDYDIIDLVAPFEPEQFIDAIDYAIDEGYKLMVMDSTTHEWDGKGGCLEIHQQAGGRYQDWGKVTPRHEKFIQKIANSPLHMICTMRGKDQYVMTQEEGNGKSKTKVEKVGVGAKQRDGFEYEFTCTFMLDQKTNTAEAMKDNTHIFESDSNVKLSEAHGERIIKWANDGVDITPKNELIKVEDKKEPNPKETKIEKSLDELKAEVLERCQRLSKSGKRDLVSSTLKDVIDSANPNDIETVGQAKEIIQLFNNL